MKKNILIFTAFLIAGIAIYRCHQLSIKPASAYQLYLEGDYYILKDGDREVYKDKFGSGSDIDHIVIQDNL